MKVTLVSSKPLIWRRFLVADVTTLSRLHDILQIVMGWTNSHLHHFFINGEYYGMRMDDGFGDMRTKDETLFKLNQLISGKGFRFDYEYDFGDSWEHELIVEKILPAEEDVYYPVCVTGKRACPPEDVGGIWGYEDFLKATANPKHPEHDELLEWIGGSFDPKYFSLEEVNIHLRHLGKSGEYDDDQSPRLEGHILKRATAWSQGLKKEQCAFAESLPVRRDMVTLLTYFKEKRPVGTQSTGNLKLKDVREVCARFVSPPVLDEKIGDQVYKLRSEEDVFWLFYLHMLANTGSLVTGGLSRVWKLTPGGEAFLDLPAPAQLGYMLSIWWHEEDWRIAFPVSGLDRGLPPNFRKITLARLLELKAGKWVSYEQFADELIVMTRLTWPSEDQTFVEDILRGVIERLIIYPLASFGCLECKHRTKTRNGFKSKDLVEICLTSLGKGLLEIL
ncbi:MAG: plasmid pRiA4b ORF-3 family protein [Chloroflexota bacterium]